jgi:hypothetical protein
VLHPALNHVACALALPAGLMTAQQGCSTCKQVPYSALWSQTFNQAAQLATSWTRCCHRLKLPVLQQNKARRKAQEADMHQL